MNINPSSLAGNSATFQTNPATSQTSERDLFMSLLVAQLKNQDPLAPQEGAEFVAQLAQFNSLDQLMSIRQSIEQLLYETQQGRIQTPDTKSE